MAPMAPKTPISFNAYYDQLPRIVQDFIRYYLKPLLVSNAYRLTFFSGLLASGVFAGIYNSPLEGTERFFVLFSAPGPVAGEGIGFALATVLAVVARYVYRRRNRVTIMVG